MSTLLQHGSGILWNLHSAMIAAALKKCIQCPTSMSEIHGYDRSKRRRAAALLMMVYDYSSSCPVTVSQAPNDPDPGSKIDCPVWQVKLKSVKPQSQSSERWSLINPSQVRTRNRTCLPGQPALLMSLFSGKQNRGE